MPIYRFPLRRLLGRYIPEPLPPAGSFDGKTVLVTGATSGLGQAAAQHFVNLGAHTIITCRDATRGENAKKAIEAASTSSTGSVTLKELDMNSYDSCVKLVDDLKEDLAGKGGIDAAVLNAGVLGAEYVVSKEGWEETLQVNTLSTSLLALLFVDWMKEERSVRQDPAHIVIVTSRDHLYTTNEQWEKYSKEGGILQHFSDKKNWPAWYPTARPHYAESKLLLTYVIEGLADLARGEDGEPQVIISPVCPGLVRTDIARKTAGVNWFFKHATHLYFFIGGKIPSYGARYFVKAATRPKEDHGKFAIAWYSYENYLKLGQTVRAVTCAHARKVQKLVWAEVITELATKVTSMGKYALPSSKPVEAE
ncbi:unnamed protein product [Clonostachys solani]|uniref:Uncharacterized protein n=1 Tax=Clonostachys solani TaxID=160281 RepID=A0A9N9W9G4_9HYPO|nr:unnamed protein product [Clonostachys solani]